MEKCRRSRWGGYRPLYICAFIATVTVRSVQRFDEKVLLRIDQVAALPRLSLIQNPDGLRYIPIWHIFSKLRNSRLNQAVDQNVIFSDSLSMNLG